VLLAFAFWRLLWRPFAAQRTPIKTALFGMGSLAGVWLVNFTVILPALNPAFVTLLPLWVTLISKLLFGAAMSAVLLTSSYHRLGRFSVHGLTRGIRGGVMRVRGTALATEA